MTIGGLPPSPPPRDPVPTGQVLPGPSAVGPEASKDGFAVPVTVRGSRPLPTASDPVTTSFLHPNAAWAQDAVAREYDALGIGFRPEVVIDRTSFVDDGSAVVHLARFKFSPLLRQLTQTAMVETTFLHLLRHESAHAFDNLTWIPQLAPSFAAAFGPHDTPYAVGVVDQALSAIRRQTSPDFVSAYAQEHPAEDFAETFAVYLRLKGDKAAIEQYVQAKGNSETLRRKFAYVARLVARNRLDFTGSGP